LAQYAFLSEEWVAEAKSIREEYRGKSSVVPPVLRMNQIITDVPGQDDPVEAHLDTSGGEAEMDFGHLDEADLTVTLDFDTAKAIMVEQDPQVGMQAFMSGKIKVQGDMTKMMALQAQPPDEIATEIAERVKAITE
jgi:putative sterol carrier protein